MNPNDLIAQQQALLNQALHRYDQTYWLIVVLQVVCFVAGVWVTYMFYARIADIARELQKLRIAYEFASARTNSPTPSASSPKDESRYTPNR